MKVRIMKIFLMTVAVAGWLTPVTAMAAVTGVCADCHVMHASQDGNALPVAGPEGYLLNQTCLGCHTGTNALATAPTSPYVYDTAAPTGTTLAGGNFYYSENGAGDRKGHNPFVTGVLAADATLTSPPGWKATGFAANGQVGTIDATHPLTCAGVYGCHGRHDGVAEGMHHADATGEVATVTGGTLGASYRFLKGIKGGEDNDYEFETAIDHNAYSGAARSAAAVDDTTGGTNTISYFCAECHGLFHSGTAATEGLSSGTLGSPWIRHPVDFSMPNSGEYAGYAAYSPLVPVATTGAGTLATTTTALAAATDRIVMCLSCHYAHAGPNDAALRWDPSLVSAGETADPDSTVGCFACHSYKDDGD